MNRIFDHVDLRVSDLKKCAAFYRAFLPMLGFTERVEIEDWLQFEAAGPDVTEFFGVTEDPAHKPNRSRIAFRAESKQRVDELASDISQTGALKIEGPEYAGPGYYAVYFEDPLGNALEICYREKKMSNCGVRRQGDAA